MTDQLYNKTREIVNALLSANADAVSKELADSPEGKLAVSIGCKLRLVGRKLYIEGSLAYSRKFTDSREDSVELPDKNQTDFLETLKESSASVTIKDGLGVTMFTSKENQ
jgi:hypothetical protein